MSTSVRAVRARPVALIAGVTAAIAASPAQAADACPNAAIRGAQHADLPDCRAYELVSPVDKAGFSVTRYNGANHVNGANPTGTEVLRDGDGFSFVGGGAVGDPQGQDGLGIPYRALRGSDGWTSIPVNGPVGPPAPVLVAATFNLGITADGSRSLVSSPVALVEGAWPCLELQIMCLNGNLYLQDNDTGQRRLIAGLAADGSEPLDSALVAATTPDFRKVLLTSSDALTADALPGIMNLFEWTDDGSARGALRLVGYGTDDRLLPAGAVAGQGRDRGTQLTERSLSADGRRIFFTSDGQLYLRQDGASTTHVSASQRATPDPDGTQAATYWTAEREHGDAVLFTSGEKLTDDAQATPAAPDLYRYEVTTGDLTDVTAVGAPAGVLGVLGASADASTVYLAATAQLVPGTGTAGDANVYRWEDDGTPHGRLSFVATLGPVADATQARALNWATGAQNVPPLAVTEDGRFLALLSVHPLTGHDTGDTVQVYRYDARTGEIACASCPPDGSAPTGDAGFRQPDRADAYRVISQRGDVAFQTEQAILPADRNGVRDVYLYGDSGPRLISTGADADLSTYAGMSASGRDVFFSTRARLVEADTDDLSDLYDARIGGGYATPPVPAPCQDDACQGRPSGGQSLPDPASRSVQGAGNLPVVGKVRATARRAARGARFAVRVRAPAAGRITITGAGLRRVGRTVRKARTVTVTVRLTARAARRLDRRGRLRVKGKVAFTPEQGAASSTTVALTIKEHR